MRTPLPLRTSNMPLAASARTASRMTVRETPNCLPSSRSGGSMSPGFRSLDAIISRIAWVTLSDSRASRSMGRNAVAFSLLLPGSMPLTYHDDPQIKRSHRLATMESLNASATLRWNGYHGSIEGGSGALSVATATQTELGGPGGESNPEEL